VKKPYRSRQKSRPPMKRRSALDIAQRYFAQRRRLSGTIREEIIATQMPPPVATTESTFAGWTNDEKRAFYESGTVPQRFRT